MKKKVKGQWSSKVILALLTLFLSTTLFAQQIPVTGTVKQADGTTLPGVTVVVKGTSQGTVTDIDGVYKLNAPGDATLVFSFVGFTPQEVAVNGQSTVDATLETDVIGLEEVVAIGYGTAKKRDITGSVGSVSADKLNASPITSLDAGLQGKIAGVSVQQQSGAPGQAMKIRIRGGSSLNYSNNPLYVIDGFIGADIRNVNPSDIATIDILKDASATAIYGSRGANGVVLITTNSPTKGAFKISAEANVGVSTMINQYELLTPVEQMTLMNEQDVTGGKDPAFPQSLIDKYANGTKQGTDWVDLITRNGVKQNYNVSATGGSDNVQYYFSANYVDEQGVIDNSFYKRGSIRSNIKAELTPKIDMVFNTYGTHTSSQANGQGTGGMGNPIGYSTVMPQLWEPYITQENINEYPSGKYEIGDQIDPNDYDNYSGTYQVGRESSPLNRVRQNGENKGDRIISNLDFTIDLGKGFSLFVSGSGSFSSGYSGSRTLEDPVTTSRDAVTARQQYSRNVRVMNTDILTYENDFGDHSVKVDAVYEFSKSWNRNISGTVGSLSTLANEWYLLGNGQPTALTSGYSEASIRSWMGRANYSFRDKYLLTASMRADGTSNFQSDNMWGYFPSAAFAWRASEEGFIQDIDWIHNLKVRAGYGTTGNIAVGPYATLPTLNAAASSNNSYYPMYDGINISGVKPGAYTDANLVWETTKQSNLGIDFSVLNGRLSAVLDVYSKNAEDVIIAQSIPRYTGYSAYTDNFAKINNSGFEFSLDWVIKQTSDFNWDFNFNIAKNTNEVKDLGGVDEIFIANEEPIGIWSLVGGGSKYIVRVGEPMGSLFGLKYEGLWQENEAEAAKVFNSKPGEPKYHDLDGDGKYSASDRQIIGTTAPDFSYGFGTTLAYKGLDFNVQCVGMVGNDIYNFANNILSQQARILSASYRDRWTPDNPDASFQTMPTGNDYSMTYVVGQYVEDGTFFKIANATLGYTLPKAWTDALKVGKIRAYVSADNLLTITDYSGLDPEASSTPANSDAQAGIDAFSYPLTRTVMGGVKINF